MKRLPRFFVLFALVLGLATAGCGSTIRPPAASVNGTDLSEKSLNDELAAIGGNPSYVTSIEQGGFSIAGAGAGTITNSFVGRVLTRQIFLELVHQEFVRRGLELAPSDRQASQPAVVDSVGGQAVFNRFPKAYQDTLIRRNAEVAKLQADLGGKTVDDAAIKAFYEANLAQFAQTCVSHVLFAATSADGQVDQAATATQLDALKTAAADAKAQIAAGADFSAVAAEKSVDASNKDKGGDLGCGPSGRFVPEFETAMDGLAVGVVSDPVVTQFGVHLIKVTDRKPETLEEATPQIRQQLEGDGQQKFSQFLQEALDKAKITVSPRYGTFTKNGQSPGIVPPPAPTTTEPGAAGGVTEQVPAPGQP